jgi:hypothetical protein
MRGKNGNSSSHKNSATTSVRQDKSESLSRLLQSKKVNWKDVQDILLGDTTASARKDWSHTKPVEEEEALPLLLADSVYHHALTKACLDPTVCPQTLQLLWICNNRSNANNLALLEKIQLGIKAARCNNTIACRALVQADDSVLSWRNARGDTLLHLVCAENGWNAAIASLVDATLELEQQREQHDPDRRGYGLFQFNVKGQCLLWLSLEGGADIVVILEHMRRHHPFYVKKHTKLLSKIVAEYCTDMTALEDLIQDDPTLFFHGDNNHTDNAPLYYACYYQNPSMIRFLLQYYLRQGEKRKKLLKPS